VGIFDFITGSRAAPSGVARQTVATLRESLLALNRDSAPWVVHDGTSDGCDLVAQWKIVDGRWYEIFARAGLTEVHKVLMRFDEERGEVRSVDQQFKVEWRAGIPHMALAAEAFRGQKVEVSFGTAYAFKETLAYGRVYEYRFRTAEIKDPLQQTVAGNGWSWKGVAFGKL
jgi:hypothetical protein